MLDFDIIRNRRNETVILIPIHIPWEEEGEGWKRWGVEWRFIRSS